MKKIPKVLGFLGGGIVLFFLFDAALMLWQLTPITSVSKYQNVKSLRWHKQSLIEHFPERILPSAKGAKLYYRAGFLQGGSSIELRLQIPAESVEEVYANYLPQAKSIFNGAEEIERAADDPN